MNQVLIIDDEQKARSILRYYLEDKMDHKLEIREAASADEALALLADFSPDIVFLDVEMPGKSGFDFLAAIKSPAFSIIFTTAFNQYAIQAIRFSALDYLLKPIDPDELKAAVQRYMDTETGKQAQRDLYQNLIQNLSQPNPAEYKIAIKSTEGAHFFLVHDIIRLEADSSYTHIFLTNGKKFTASKTLKYMEEMLEGHGFLRTHKSHLINTVYLRQVNADHSMATMSDGSTVEVARRKKEEIKELVSRIS
jgi:two-component system LytT family response regulator